MFVSKTRRYSTSFAFVLSCLPPASAAQAPAPLSAIHARLQDHRGLAKDHAFVFVGEISQMKTIPRSTCKAGVEHKITYRVSEVLWVEPDSPIVTDYKIEKGFIDCAQKPLPSPEFAVGVKVIVLCGLKLGFFQCLPPVSFTRQDLQTIQTWLEEVRRDEGDPALLKIHEALLQSAERLRKQAAISPRMASGQPNRPFVFVGQVNSIDKPPQFPIPMSVIPRLHMDIAVSQVLWGAFKEPVVHAWCNSRACGGAELNEKVIVHCEPTISFAECTAPAVYSEESFKKVQSWVAEINRE
jgi:hypothetical protein